MTIRADDCVVGPAVASPESRGVRLDAPLPLGTVVELSGDTRPLADGVLLGGSPRRLLRLSGTGVAALDELARGPVVSVAAGILGRRLTDAGLAVALPPLGAGGQLSATVVVPVRDRVEALERCLESLGNEVPVIVVDDGSRDQDAVSAVCAAHEAALVRRPAPGGPAAARNTGMRRVESDLVAFCDSDCAVPPGWVETLSAHFDDPLVVAVAPRVAGDRRVSPLDLGTRSGPVSPLTRLSYAPAAALLVRRAALGGGFDEDLRYGEDVDLIWRLVDAGWKVRYDHRIVITHAEPTKMGERARRRFHYGTSAATLASRHPGKVRHLALSWPEAIVVGAVMAGYPSIGAAGFCGSLARHVWRMGRRGVAARVAIAMSTEATASAWTAMGRWLGQFAVPVVAVYLVGRGRRGWRGRPGWRRYAVVTTVVASLVEGCRAEPGGEGAATRLFVSAGEEVAYGAGVCAGWVGRYWRERTHSGS